MKGGGASSIVDAPEAPGLFFFFFFESGKEGKALSSSLLDPSPARQRGVFNVMANRETAAMSAVSQDAGAGRRSKMGRAEGGGHSLYLALPSLLSQKETLDARPPG